MKVGEYVRTDKGEIGKITSIAENNDFGLGEEYRDFVAFNTEPYVYGDVIKKGQLIDLVEVKDYVNGMEVTRICFDENGKKILNLSNCILELMNEDIKSIVTKEQFSQREYRIGE